MLLNTIPIPLSIGYVVIINLLTAGAYAGDKIAAQGRARCVPEKTLWLLNLLGGVIAPGWCSSGCGIRPGTPCSGPSRGLLGAARCAGVVNSWLAAHHTGSCGWC